MPQWLPPRRLWPSPSWPRPSPTSPATWPRAMRPPVSCKSQRQPGADPVANVRLVEALWWQRFGGGDRFARGRVRRAPGVGGTATLRRGRVSKHLRFVLAVGCMTGLRVAAAPAPSSEGSAFQCAWRLCGRALRSTRAIDSGMRALAAPRWRSPGIFACCVQRRVVFVVVALSGT